uniref:CYTH domain-containing protein n=1 Tax=Romanomermis culicivorax TaxID=13658 RepID=A0A915IAQ2_ROMCU
PNGELIFYSRSDESGPKLSTYDISSINDALSFETCLSKGYGIRGVVKKRRKLFMLGQTRIHLDQVEILGSFLELEVVLNEYQTLECGEIIANGIMDKLNIGQNQLISAAYIDLICESKHA